MKPEIRPPSPLLQPAPAGPSSLVTNVVLGALTRPIPWAFSICALAWAALIWAWEPSYLTLVVDDSFYYLEIARHLAAGAGSTFDGINPTNGYHPGWMGVFTALSLFVGDNPAVLMRVALTLQLGLVLGGTVLLARANLPGARRLRLVVGLALANFYFMKVLVNGQESALQYALLCVTLVASLRGMERTVRGSLLLGVLAGLTALTRLDAAFFGVTLAAMPLIWPSQETARLSFGERLARAAATGAGLSLCLVPYLAHNHVTTGHLLPVSGAIKAGAAVTTGLVVRVGVAALALAVPAALLVGRGRLLALGRRGDFARAIYPLVGYVALETAYLAAVRGVLVPEIWYLVPHFLLAMLLLVAAMDSSLVRHWVRRRVTEARRRGHLFSAASGAVIIFAGLTWVYRLDPASYARFTVAREMSQWASDNLPESAVLASWDAGAVGAHTRQPVVNLDGLASSWDYKENYLDHRRTDDFITQVVPVTHLIQYFDPDALLAKKDPSWRGVPLSGWHVAAARCFDARLALNPLAKRKLVYVVLSRSPEDQPMSDFLAGLRGLCNSS
ncbi:MAG: hypothetical protein R3F14_33160 [Polyangiaceae bacterium]